MAYPVVTNGVAMHRKDPSMDAFFYRLRVEERGEIAEFDVTVSATEAVAAGADPDEGPHVGWVMERFPEQYGALANDRSVIEQLRERGSPLPVSVE